MQTILQCPHCGKAARTTKVIPPGAKVTITCKGCGEQFRPSGNGSVKNGDDADVPGIPLEELLAPDDYVATGGRPRQGVPDRPLRELLATNGRGARSSVVDEGPSGRYESLTNSKVVLNPLAPSAESSKQRLIGGKQVRFGTSRQYTAVLLLFVLGVGGYLGFWGFVTLIRYIQSQSDVAKNYRERMGKAPNAADPKKKGEAAAETAALPEVPTLVQAVAGKPAKVSDWEVCLEKAEVGPLQGGGPQEYLFITLRVTNLAPGPRTYRYWSKPGKNTVIRNPSLAYLYLVPGTAPEQDEARIDSQKTYRDILVLEAAAGRFDLDLTLLLPPPSKSGFVIHMPSAFVSRPG